MTASPDWTSTSGDSSGLTTKFFGSFAHWDVSTRPSASRTQIFRLDPKAGATRRAHSMFA